MTSNLPPENRLGFNPNASSIEEEKTLSSVRKNFRPEFLNRIDKIIIFKHLEKDIIKKIVKQHLDLLCEQVSKDYEITLAFSDEVLKFIAEIGTSETNGAREIQRVIEQTIKEPLSEDILHFQSKGEKISGNRINLEKRDKKIDIIWKSIGKKMGNITVPPDTDDNE